jgi:hypothetical protein
MYKSRIAGRIALIRARAVFPLSGLLGAMIANGATPEALESQVDGCGFCLGIGSNCQFNTEIGSYCISYDYGGGCWDQPGHGCPGWGLSGVLGSGFSVPEDLESACATSYLEAERSLVRTRSTEEALLVQL